MRVKRISCLILAVALFATAFLPFQRLSSAGAAPGTDAALVKINAYNDYREVVVSGIENLTGDVKMTVWTEKNGTDDIYTVNMTDCDGGVWKANITPADVLHSGAVYINIISNGSVIGVAETAFSSTDFNKNVYVAGEGNYRDIVISRAFTGKTTGATFAIWSETNGQDDLKWISMTKQANGTWKSRISLVDFASDGKYQVHVYNSNQTAMLCHTSFNVVASDRTQNVVEMHDYGKLVKLSVGNVPSSKTISYKVAAWTAANGQDDLKWYNFTKQSDGTWAAFVKSSDRKDNGVCYFHVYQGSSTFVKDFVVDISSEDRQKNVYKIIQGKGCYTASLEGNYGEMASDFRVAVWSNAGGQDDLKWYNLSLNDKGIYTAEIPLNKFKHSGVAFAHFYNGNTNVKAMTFEINPDDYADAISSLPNSDIVTPGAEATQTVKPTEVPTAVPTAVPTEVPTAVPTEVPTVVPTATATQKPTEKPTAVPTVRPTAKPTASVAENSVAWVSVTGAGRVRHVVVKSKIAGDTQLTAGLYSAINGPDDAHRFDLKKQSDGTWAGDITTDYLLHAGTCCVATNSENEAIVIAEIYVDEEDLRTPVLKATAAVGGIDITLSSVALGNNNVKLIYWNANGDKSDARAVIMDRTASEEWKYKASDAILKPNTEYVACVYAFEENYQIATCTFKTGNITPQNVKINSYNGYKEISVTNADKTWENLRIAVWTKTGGMDDVYFTDMKNPSDGTFTATFTAGDVLHSGTVYVNILRNDEVLGTYETSFTSSECATKLYVTGSGNYRDVVLSRSFSNQSAAKFAIWSDANGQDDLKWIDMTKNDNGTWSARVSLVDFPSNGRYLVHAYNGSLTSCLATTEFDVTAADRTQNVLSMRDYGDVVKLVISNVPKTQTIKYKVAAWSAANGQDDLKWYDFTKQSDGTWAVFVKSSDRKDNGACYFHVYQGSSTFVKDYTVDLSSEDRKGKTFNVIPGKDYYTATISGACGDMASDIRVAVWTKTTGQDDLKWYPLTLNEKGVYEAKIPLANLKHCGEAYAHFYNGNTNIYGMTFVVDEGDYIRAIASTGSNSNIDFVQAAANIANNNQIGYGHTWPATISCVGMIGVSLTGCGYVDLTSYDPHDWGYLDINPVFVSVLEDELECTRINGTFNKNNYSALRPGDLLYSDSHVGIYLGDGRTIEARGDVNNSDTDGGSEVHIYNWKNGDPVSFPYAYRLPHVNDRETLKTAMLIVPGTKVVVPAYNPAVVPVDPEPIEPEIPVEPSTEPELSGKELAEKLFKENGYVRVNAIGEYDENGGYVYFGSYPKTLVTDYTMTVGFTGTSGDPSKWTSFRYFANGSQSDYMVYKDLFSGDDIYRGVYFSQYRPSRITTASSASNSEQDNNGFESGTVYWFKFEPIMWKIIDESNGAMTLWAVDQIDSQYFDNTSNIFATSAIKSWLNTTFMNTAFSDGQKAKLQTIDGGKVSLFGSSTLLAQKTDLKKVATDYAKCQGSYMEGPYGYYWTSTAFASDARRANVILNDGTLSTNTILDIDAGVVPCVRIVVNG